MLCIITRGVSTKRWINTAPLFGGREKKKKKLKSRFYSSFKNKSCLSSFPRPPRCDRAGRDAALAPRSLSHTARCLGEPLPRRGAGPAAGGTRRAAPFAPRLATARRSGHSRRPNGRRSAGADGELACRAAGGQQRQFSSQERVRCGSEGRPRSPPPHSPPQAPRRERPPRAARPGACTTPSPPPTPPTPAAGRGKRGAAANPKLRPVPD